MSDSVDTKDFPMNSFEPPSPPPSNTPQRLGQVLQEGRRFKGLELSDISEITHVRKEYLTALEEGNYDNLPEEVYAKNFLRLYAQAVGLDEARLLGLFNKENVSHKTHVASSGNLPPSAGAAPRRRINFGGFLSTLLLIAVVVLGALWGYRNVLLPSISGGNPTDTQPQVSTPDNPDATPQANVVPQTDSVNAGDATGEDATTQPAIDEPNDLILLSLESTPSGAEVTIDGYPIPGTTPILNIPVTAGESRQLRLSLDGYEVYEDNADLSFDRNLSVALTPLTASAIQTTANTANPEGTGESTSPAIASEGNIAITVESASWLEVYQSTARGVGERLVYTTAQAGQTYEFSLPVYLHIGNAGGLRYSVSGQDRGLLGSSGEVVSRAVTE